MKTAPESSRLEPFQPGCFPGESGTSFTGKTDGQEGRFGGCLHRAKVGQGGKLCSDSPGISGPWAPVEAAFLGLS